MVTQVANDNLWQTKVHARLHDPAEKALVLLRDPAGHEGGTVRTLHEALFPDGIPSVMKRHVERADWWAAAADRPQWPMDKGARWAQVHWTKYPVLIHPLTGREFKLRTLADTDIGDIKERSLQHLRRYVVPDGEDLNWRQKLCALWRFGPELSEEDEDHGKLGLLWPLLPADTRVPDHSIWDHLDLTSAFAGAFAADAEGGPALLALSLGPVQDFIAAARTTSDLWAGSHLLARLSWEAMKVVCEQSGPDAILFPRLRGLPQVDLWLRDEIGLPRDWFGHCQWTRSATDANMRRNKTGRFRPHCQWTRSATDANLLFAAALTNRFVAVVPKDRAKDLAEKITCRVREWLKELGCRTVDRLLETADLANGDERHCHRQTREQLDGFPEVHWASIPFSLIRARNEARQTDLDTLQLSKAMAPFFGADPSFLDGPAWKVLQKELSLDGVKFYSPNPGVLYPAVYDLAERVLAAAKTARPFQQTRQTGWRCSLTGETEWLTADAEQLEKSYRHRTDTLWAKVNQHRPAWAKKREHLGALAAVKRLWPTLFAKEVAKAVDAEEETGVDRFVVSTHTMAWARNLEELDRVIQERGATASLSKLARYYDAPVLPRRLAYLRSSLAARIPTAMEHLRESSEDDDNAAAKLRELEGEVAKLLGHGHRPETYYALILMDGDRMGSILSGDQQCAISYSNSFHPKIRTDFDKLAASNPTIKAYGDQKRAVSPGRHLAISGSLNDFAIHVVPHVLEEEFHGKLIYAGGDDVLAMLPVADLLCAMRRLRNAYSGTGQKDVDWRSVRNSEKLVCKDGFAYLQGRLMRMMGEYATASCGAVVAHHQAPLAAVLRQLRETEQRAKNEGGRNAFSITVVKRSGGALHLTDNWGEPLALLMQLRNFLSKPNVSRRAAYNSVTWLRDLPDDAEKAMLKDLLTHVFLRQSRDSKPHCLAEALAELVCQKQEEDRKEWKNRLKDFLFVAEFLARETRAPALSTSEEQAA